MSDSCGEVGERAGRGDRWVLRDLAWKLKKYIAAGGGAAARLVLRCF